MFAFSIVNGKSDVATENDGLRQTVTKKGLDDIPYKLERALEIFVDEKEDALSLIKSSLFEAQEAGEKALEMQAYYTFGRIHPGFNNINISQAYYDTALIISNEIEDNWYKGKILFRQGANLHNKGEDIHALEVFNKALQACRLSNNYKILGSSYSMMGTIFRVNGIYDRAIEYIIKSKLNYEKANFTEGFAWAAYLLGRIHADLRLPQKAREYFEESLKIYQELAAIDGKGNGVAICLEQIGLLNLEAGNLEESRKNIEQVLIIHTEGKSKYGISNAYKHLGQVEYSMGNYVLAKKHLKEALKIKKEISDIISQPGIYEYLGLSIIGIGQVEEGLKNMFKGLELALANNQKKVEMDIYAKLTQTYLEQNDFEKAIFYQNKQIETHNLVLAGAASIKMEQLQAIYELDIKSTQIEELKKQNEINSLRINQHKIYQTIMIIGILVVLLISATIYLFYRKIRQKNSSLNEANATKDKLFSIIAHDLKGPIGSVSGLSDFLVEEIQNEDLHAASKIAVAINQSLNDTFNLLNNLLEWARSQLQRIEFKPRQLVLVDILEDEKVLLSFQATKKNIEIQIDVEDDLHVFADKDMLKTILRNLVSNAIKFSNLNEKVSIKAIKNETSVELTVLDNGVGMEPNVVNNLFKLESNISKPGTSGEKGTGLGLILVKEFVQRNGGKIWVESEVQKGSTFRFTLPIS